MPLTSETFSCGHEKTPENTGTTPDGKARYAVCITCRRERDRLRKASPEYKARKNELLRVKRYEKAGREVPVTKRTRAAANAATDHLKLPIRAIKAESELHLAMEEDRAKCEDRSAEWIDFEEPPNRSVARAMCEGCPLLRECGIFADESKPAWGVWGGSVYVDGKAI